MGLWDKAKGMLINDSTPKPEPGSKDMSLDEMLSELEDKPKKAAAPALDDYRVPQGLKLGSKPDGTSDFGPIYNQAGVPQTPFTSEQMLELLMSYPDTLPPDVKRSTALISLEAIGKSTGASLEGVIGDAAAKVTALNSFAESLRSTAMAEVEAAQAEVKQLMAQIEARRKSIDVAQAQMQQSQQAVNDEQARHKTVLEFFKQNDPAMPAASAPPKS
jgi:hypothetical protein